MLNLFPQNTDSDAGTRPAPPRRGAGGYGIWSDRRAGGAGWGEKTEILFTPRRKTCTTRQVWGESVWIPSNPQLFIPAPVRNSPPPQNMRSQALR